MTNALDQSLRRLERLQEQPVRYPWDKWFKQPKLRLFRGRDYLCMPHSMGQQVRNAASIRGLRVSVYIRGEGITVTRR